MLYILRMRYIKLTDLERETLEEGYKHHTKSHVRQRCQSLLLSDEDWPVKQIAQLHHVRTAPGGSYDIHLDEPLARHGFGRNNDSAGAGGKT